MIYSLANYNLLIRRFEVLYTDIWEKFGYLCVVKNYATRSIV